MLDARTYTDLFVDAWADWVRQVPGHDITRSNDLVAALGNVPLPFLNCVFQTEELETPDAFRGWLRRALDAAPREHGTLFPVCEPWLPDGWQEIAAEVGLGAGILSTGMAADALAEPVRPLPDIELRIADDPETVRDLTRLNAAAYGMPEELFEIVSELDYSGSHMHGIVGYASGEPVSCAAALPVRKTVYVGWVATHPDHQRRGYAEAAMRRAISACSEATGLTRTTLHASEAGYSLYSSMGYRPGARFPLLMAAH